MNKKKLMIGGLIIGGLALIILAGFFIAQITGSKCPGFCTNNAQQLLDAKSVCESGLGSTDQPTLYGVKCDIKDNCLSCKECRRNYCTLPGVCVNGYKHYTCINECTGTIQERSYTCNDPTPTPKPSDDECSSDSECNDNNVGTTDRCTKVGQILGLGGHYECQNTATPYYAERVECAARTYFSIENGYEWKDNPTQQCWLSGVFGTGLFCKTVSQPFCQLKVDYVVSTIVIGLVILISLAILSVWLIKRVIR